MHDAKVIADFSDVLASRLHPYEEQVSNDPQLFPAFQERVYRFCAMLMAKKLSTSLSEDQALQFGGNLSRISKVPVYSPTPLVQLFDHFGSIEYDKHRFVMVGQPIIAFTYFARAVLEDPVTNNGLSMDRRENLYLNVSWNGAAKQLYDFALGVVHAWAVSMPPTDFLFGNQVVRMTVPVPTSGIGAYSVFIEGVPKPPGVLTCLRVATIIEPFVNQALTPDLIAQLAQMKVGVVNWNNNMITSMCENYSLQVESRIRMAFSKATNWAPVNMFKTKGSPGQLLRRTTESTYHGPLVLSGDVLDLGWLAAGSESFVRLNGKACYLTPPATQRQGLSLIHI